MVVLVVTPNLEQSYCNQRYIGAEIVGLSCDDEGSG
jgi:hypothetical protein